MQLELVSIDLSNYCSKACTFCYNQSNAKGVAQWQPNEVISFALDCAANGVKAFSLGGGEPFEYAGIFEVISALTPHLFVSITSNGLPLIDKKIFDKLISHKPNKIHVSIHNPSDKEELRRSLFLVRKIAKFGIKAGLNFLVSNQQIESAKYASMWLYRNGILSNQIIFIPIKGKYAPSTKQLAEVAGTEQFQSTFCLTECKPSARFCSVSYDKKVNYCSYSKSKETMTSLDYSGLINALQNIKTFAPCY
ncbi:MAG: radical SAM protein [Bacteroidales bacterium]|nr:radical SAM protein [Bacteroidales bacterium]